MRPSLLPHIYTTSISSSTFTTYIYIYITHLYYIYASIIYTTFIQQTHIAYICTAHIPSTHVPPTYLPLMYHTEPRHRVANISHIHICTTFSCERFTITIITWITATECLCLRCLLICSVFNKSSASLWEQTVLSNLFLYSCVY